MKKATRLLLSTEATRVATATCPLRLEEQKPEDEKKPRWVQVAREGAWKGHPAGEFELDADAFGQMVENFHRHPAYTAGESGVGEKPVIPFDFHHASEDTPSNLAREGAPAQGWALELEVRTAEDGKLELWALADLLEPMATYIRERRYRWTSIAAWPEAKDPVSGEAVGWYLSSIAFTNDPFIQGMVPLAATKAAAEELAMKKKKSKKPQAYERDAVDHRDALQLSSGPSFNEVRDALNSAVQKLYPPSDDYRYQAYVCDVYATTAVYSYDGKEYECEYKYDGSEVTLGQPVEVRRTYQPTASAALSRAGDVDGQPRAATERFDMSLLKLLAQKYDIPTDEESVQKRILAELAGGEEAKNALRTLLELLDAEDLASAQEKVAAFDKAKADLQAVLPNLGSMYEEEAAAEDEQAMADVDAAMAAHRLPEVAKSALVLERKGGLEFAKADPKARTVESVLATHATLAARRAAKGAFAKKFAKAPEASADPTSPAGQQLQQPIVTAPGNAQRDPFEGIQVRADGTMVRTGPAPQLPPPKGSAGEFTALIATVRMTQGRNLIDRCINMFRAKHSKDSGPFDLESAHEQACILIAQAREMGVVQASEY